MEAGAGDTGTEAPSVRGRMSSFRQALSLRRQASTPRSQGLGAPGLPCARLGQGSSLSEGLSGYSSSWP